MRPVLLAFTIALASGCSAGDSEQVEGDPVESGQIGQRCSVGVACDADLVCSEWSSTCTLPCADESECPDDLWCLSLTEIYVELADDAECVAFCEYDHQCPEGTVCHPYDGTLLSGVCVG